MQQTNKRNYILYIDIDIHLYNGGCVEYVYIVITGPYKPKWPLDLRSYYCSNLYLVFGTYCIINLMVVITYSVLVSWICIYNLLVHLTLMYFHWTLCK